MYLRKLGIKINGSATQGMLAFIATEAIQCATLPAHAARNIDYMATHACVLTEIHMPGFSGHVRAGVGAKKGKWKKAAGLATRD